MGEGQEDTLSVNFTASVWATDGGGLQKTGMKTYVKDKAGEIVKSTGSQIQTEEGPSGQHC